MSNHFRHAVLPVVLAIIAMARASAGQSSTPSNSSSTSVALLRGTAMVAELAKSIDAKKVKPGDPVKAKVTQDVVSGGEVVIPRGSKVMGHVTEVKAFSKEQPQSILGVVFDKVILKGGQDTTFNGVLQALAPHVEDQPDTLPSTSYGGSRSSGSQPVSHGSSHPIVDPRDRVDHTRDNALKNAADPSSYPAGANTLHNGLLSTGNRGVFGMPDIFLRSQAGMSGSRLISTKASIKLESGTQMVLEILGGGRGSN